VLIRLIWHLSISKNVLSYKKDLVITYDLGTSGNKSAWSTNEQ